MTGHIHDWKELLGLEGRTAPEVFERDRPIEDSPYAGAIKKAIIDLGIVGLYCVQGVPQIAVLEQRHYSREEVVRVRAALWNQGLVSVLVVIANDQIQVFSLVKAPARDEQSEDCCLIETLDAATTGVSLRNYVFAVESGRIWRDMHQYFEPKERIDAVLLQNLTAARKLLVKDGLTSVEAQVALMQTMFIAYLEDRKIVGPDYFKRATGNRHEKFTSLLEAGDYALLEGLFAQLRKDFNGDLFVAPCSFEPTDHPRSLSRAAMQILRRLREGREGREEMSERQSQLRFWGYDFKYIPVELISAVYDRFLGQDEARRRKAGAYYTPMFLADTVMASLWDSIDDRVKDEGVFLDPACGSGIFLVRCFQRLCDHGRAHAGRAPIAWGRLKKLLQRVRGTDLNGDAVRVAIFSLYIALLEEAAPEGRAKLDRGNRRLPSLWKVTLAPGDFFAPETDRSPVDVVVGNPPWTSKPKGADSGMDWCKARRLPTPNRQEAWAFVWKALDRVGPDGTIAFLLPSMGFLHNHTAESVAARVQLFEQARMERVINFSDLRRQLFAGSANSTSLLLFRKNGADGGEIQDYQFDYWTPKADLNVSSRRFVAVSAIDKSTLRLSEVQRSPAIFTQRLWMQGPEVKLFSFLDSLPKLEAFVKVFAQLTKEERETSSGWVIGQGFGPLPGTAPEPDNRKDHRSAFVGKEKHLPTEALGSVTVDPLGLEPWPSDLVRRLGFERGFSGSRVLILKGGGGRAAGWRLRAAYVEEPLTFRDSIRALVAPSDEQDHTDPADQDQAKFITAILNSRLAAWFAFHGTSSLGSSRPEVHQAELLKLPLPAPDDLGDPASAREARQELIELVVQAHEERAQATGLLRSADTSTETLREIDHLTYKYFGLTQSEITLIEDAVENVMPAVQPSAPKHLSLCRPTLRNDREAYAGQLEASLLEWFEEGQRISIALTGHNEDLGILRLKLGGGAEYQPYREYGGTTFAQSLQELADALEGHSARNFQLHPDMRIFLHDDLYLIKPMQRRFWLRSTAQADADGIAADILAHIHASCQRRAAS